MPNNVKIALSIFEDSKEYPEIIKNMVSSQRIDNENFDPDNLGFFNLTEVEIQDAPKAFQAFLRKNNLIVNTLIKHNQTEPYSKFLINFNRLKSFLKLAENSFDTSYAVIESNPKILFGDFGYNTEDDDVASAFKNYSDNFSESRYYVLYEYSLIYLLAVFEAYISDILKWIYKNDTELIKHEKTHLSYDDILNNYDSFINFFISEYVDNIKDWKDRRSKLSKSLKVELSKIPAHNIIQEANDRRNLLIHHGGRVNKKFFNLYNSPKFHEKIVIDSEYYYKVQNSVFEIAKLIEDTVLYKYHQKK